MAPNPVRFDPFSTGLDALRHELFGDGPFRNLRGKMPATDIYTDNDEEFVVEVHLPGFAEDDLNVAVDSGALVIQAQRHEQQEDKSKKYVVRESSTSFYRSIALPEQADEQQIRASFNEGVLRITAPLKELSAPTKIEIGSGGAS
jgi:HSP20 family protein